MSNNVYFYLQIYTVCGALVWNNSNISNYITFSYKAKLRKICKISSPLFNKKIGLMIINIFECFQYAYATFCILNMLY